jgi:hypothetical protein
MNAQAIIAALYSPSNENSVEHERELKKIMENLENAPDFTLFDSKMLEKLEQSNELMPYLCAMLKAIMASRDEKGTKRRLLCFQKSIALMKCGRLSETHCKTLADRLFASLRLLQEDQARCCVEKIIDDFDPSNASKLAGHGKALG